MAPIANAGLDQTVASGETVTLDGRGSMDDGSINSYYWIDAVDDNPSTPEDFKFASQRRGAIVTFTAPTVAPGAANVTLRYAVEVTDEAGAKSDSTLSDAIVAITITPPSSNVRPVANAGTDQTVASGATVTLEGSGTDNGGTIQGYYWVQSSTGTAPALSAYNVAGPTLTAPTLAEGDSDVTFSYALRVRDDAGAVSDDDEVTITVKDNLTPIANAGPDQTVVSGATVELDGSGSRDDDGEIAGYTWFGAVGRPPPLTDVPGTGNEGKRTLTAPTLNVGDPPVKFSYGLRVEDDDGAVSDPDLVEITVTAPDTTAPTGAFEPVAATHDGMTPIIITANFSEPVTGFEVSDITRTVALPVGFPVGTYGPTITNFAEDPNDETQYTFTLTPRAPITISLRVVESMDDDGYTDKAGNVGKSLFRQVVFSGSNWPPVVTTGNDRSVVSGTPVTLEGTGKDIDGTVASYAWARTGGTQGAMAPLTNANTAMASFTANTLEAGAADETHEFTLTVTDDDGATSTETVTITVTAPFVTTVAEAGDDQSVASGAMVELVGSDSKVDRRRTATYAWARTGGTTGGTATLTNANMKTASFTADTLVDGNSDVIHIFTLTVTDDLNVISTDTVTVKVLAPDSSDTTPPMAVFQNLPSTHDGETAFTVEVKFTEPVVGFGLDKIFGSLDGNPSNADQIGVLRTNFTPDPNDSTLYTITLTPRAKYSFRVLISGVITDASGNALAQVTQVLIRYAAPIAPPVAHAGGDQIVFSGETVTLDGSGTSDEDDLIEVYLWERTGGTSTARPMITDADKVQASFVADTLTAGASDVTHIIRLTVTDAAGNTDTDSATITVKEPFATPVANAGPDQLEVVSGAPVQLDGSGSSVDRRRTATYSWARTGGTTGGMVTFSPSATVESPTFPADTLTESDSDVTHIFTLTVTDGEGGRATDMVTVIVKAPVPDTTGPTGEFEVLAQTTHDGMTPFNQAVEFNEPVVGFTAADINRDAWNIPPDADPNDYNARISEFEQDSTNPLRYTFILTPISDRQFTVSIPAKSITDAAGNQNLRIAGQHFTYSTDPSTPTFPALTAEAGPPKSVVSEMTVTLDGSGTETGSGRNVTYLWTQTSGTGGTLTSETTLTPSFTAPALNPGDADAIHIFTLTVSDDVVGSTPATDTVMVTVTAPMFPALTAEAGPPKSVVSEMTVTLDGSGTETGSGRNVTYLWTQTSGTGGTLTSETTLTPSFTAPALNPGDADAIHIFTLTVSDDVVGSTPATDTVMVTVTAPEFPALTAEAGPPKSVVSEMTVTLDGSGTETGSGRNVTYLWTQTSGTGGTLTSETTLTPSFTAPALNPGDADAIHIFTLTVSDDVVGSTPATDTVMVTVTAPMFPALTAEAGPPKSVVSEMTVTLDGSGTETGSGRNVTYLWTQTSGTGGTLTSETTLTPSFTAPALNPGDADAIHIFTLTVSDDVVGSTPATDTVMVTVTAPMFPALTAEAGPPKSVVSEMTVTLDGSGTETGSGRNVTYLWTQTSGTGGMLTSETTLTPSFTAPALNPGDADATHTFTLTVSDDVVGSTPATDTVTVTVTSPFADTVAEAGSDKTVASGGTVTLDGRGSTSDRRFPIGEYDWTRTSGTGGSLTDTNNAQATFTAPTLTAGAEDELHIFTLKVTDSDGDSDTDTVTITVTTGLVAEAGPPKSVVSEMTVTLDGSGTETDSNRTVTYAWTQTSGTGGTLTGETTLTPSFTAPALNPGDADAIHVFTLTVRDNQGSTAATDTVRVTVTAPEFPALTAEAGPPKSVVSEMTVTLDGSGTETGSGRNVTYLWTQTSGTGGTLTSETTLTPSFTAPALNPGDADAIHIFTLTVSDDVVGSTPATDTVMVTVTAPMFPALTAEAGPPKSVVSEMTVTLDGSGTETGSGRNVTYLWTQTSGTGGTLTGETTLTPSFTAPALNPGDADAIHIFTLTVSDDVVGSTAATDTVMVTVTAPMFPALTAEAGPPKSVVSEMTVTLDGSGTETGSGRNVTYLWTQTSGTGGTLTSETTLTPSFTAPALNPGDAAVTYVFTLTVSDNQNTPDATDTVTVTVTAPAANVAPVADAGPNQRLVTGGLVTLDGSRSMDPDGTTVNYAWARSDSPDHGNGGTVTLSDPAAAKPTFTALTPDAGAADATYGFTLTVTDAGGATHKDTVTITVNAPPLANAGRDRMVASTATVVTLDGSGSSDSTGQFRYAWMRSLAPNRGNAGTVILTGEDEEMPTFTPVSLDPGAPDAIYGFTLTVTDNDGVTAVAMVKITLTSGLIANAGADKSVASEGTVTLDGSGSSQTDSTRTVTYLWTQTGGTGGTLADADKATARFTAPALNPGDADAIHTFTLTVSDDVVGSTAATDTVTVTVTAPMFPALTANAGSDKSVVSEGTVTLDGSGTATGSGRNVTYLWTRPSGTGGSLTGETTLTPSFKAPALNPGDADAIHTFTLTVTDNQGSTQATDTVEITVTAPEFDALVANAGADKSVASEATVTLDGSGSSQTDSSRTVTYLWTQTGGTGGTLADADKATARFTAPALNPGAADATHTFTLTVTDSDGVTAVDTVTITVTPPFAALVAQAGDPQTVGSGATVTLDGSGSTGSDINRTVTYAWERTGGTVGATAPLTSANTLEPTFKADTLAPGANAVTHIFTLTVTDNAGSTEATDTVTITVNVRSVVRIVNPAGPDGTIQAAPGAVVTLVGSVDPDVDVESYLWRRTGGTGDPNVVLNGADTATLMFTADTADTAQASFVANTPEPDVPGVNHSFTLTVKDKGGVRHTSDRVTVRVSSVAQVDVDIRVLRPIGGYLETRATALLNTQPDLTRFLEQDGTIPGGSGDFTFRATNGRVALDGGFVRDGVWGQVTGSYASSDSGDVKSVLGSFGFHRKYSERFLAGAMLQFDLADHDLARQAGMIDGTGWLVGPYFAARNGKRPLYFEGRLLYGQSDNDIRFIDTGTGIGVRNGSFDTKRLLAQLRVQGEIALSDENGGPRLIPYADVRWVEDRAATFTTVSATGLRNSVPGQKVSVGQLELGSNVEVPIAMSHGAMTFTGGLGLVYSNTEGDFIPSVSRSRGRGEIGLSYGLDDNVQIDFESFYDGIGTSEYEGYGLSLRAEMKF